MDSKKKKEESEDSKIDEILESSRRDFLKKVGIAGAATIAGAAAVYSGFKFEKSKSTGDTVKVLTADNRLVEVPADQVKDYKPPLKLLQKRGREGIPGKRCVMIIDLSKCRNARKCVAACQ